MRELVCTVCPKGCRITAGGEDSLTISGHGCARGEAYARAELLAPERVLTSTVRVEGGICRRCPVKTKSPIPKAMLHKAMEQLNAVRLTPPVTAGQVIVDDLCGSGVPLVSTRDILR